MRTTRALVWTATVLATLAICAAEEAGAPAPAPDAAAPLPYLTTAELNARLREVVGRARSTSPEGFPPPAQVVVVGTSLRGEEILAVEIGAGVVASPPGDGAPGALRRNAGQRQALLVVAGVEGDRLVGTSVATSVIEELLALGAEELSATLHGNQLYVVPRVNPDGARRYFEGLPSSSWKPGGPSRYEHPGNARVFDRDRDGRRAAGHEGELQLAEDGPVDLDGDGAILQMRWLDAEGKLREDAEDPRVMFEADPKKGEEGLYLVADEGTDLDGDGDFAENSAAGVNPNRNFPHAFAEHDAESGLFATSEPESRALLDYVLARKNISMVVVYGAHDNLGEVPEAAKEKQEAEPEEGHWRRGPRQPATKLHAADREILVALSELRREVGGLPGKNAVDPEGAFHQWAYFHFGVPAMAINLFQVDDGVEAAAKRRKDEKGKGGGKHGEAEAGGAPTTRPAGTESPTGGGAEERPEEKPEEKPEEEAPPDPVAVAQEEAGKDGFVPWHEFDHPVLGRVELGGWKPYVRGNPSPEVAGILAIRELAFIEGLLERFSNVHLVDVTVDRKGAGVYEIEAVIANDGKLPSAIQQGVDNREALPVIVLLDTPKESLLQGERRESIDRLEASVGERRIQWLVRGKAGSKILLVVAPPRSHPITREVELP